MQRNARLIHPNCNGEIVESVPQGIQTYRDIDPQVYQCDGCGKVFTSEEVQKLRDAGS